MPVRKVVTRSGKGFRGKFPSRKMGCVLQWESLHERDALLICEYTPGIKAYEHQPSEEIFYDEAGKAQRYFPDLKVTFESGDVVWVEVKPSEKLEDPKTARKYALVAQYFSQQQRRFEIWTEREIRREPRFSTIKEIHRSRSRFGVDLTSVARLRDSTRQQHRLRDADEALGGRANVLRLIALGELRVDVTEPLNDHALVSLVSPGGHHDSV